MLTILAFVELAVELDPRNAQSWHPGTIDRALPAGELLQTQRIDRTSFVDSKEPASHSGKPHTGQVGSR